MDYAIEYALMAELYDERSAALEGEMSEYVNTHHGIGKVGAVIKYIWTKICAILAHILTIIPRAIASIATGVPVGANATKAARIGQLAGQRYGEIVKKVNRLTAITCRDILNTGGKNLGQYTNEMEKYAEDIENLKSWFIKYMGDVASKIIAKTTDSEARGDLGGRVSAAVAWKSITEGAKFEELCKGISDAVKPFNTLAHNLQNSQKCSEETSKTAMRFATALSKIATIITNSISEGRGVIFAEDLGIKQD